MKNLYLSMLILLSFLFFIVNFGEAAVPCPTVNAKAAACVGFATGMVNKPSYACCTRLQQLAQTVKTVDDKKTICRCLKAGATSFGIQDKFLSKIPQACNIKVGFPVSTNTVDAILCVMKSSTIKFNLNGFGVGLRLQEGLMDLKQIKSIRV